jgi:hypothetical protein
MNPQFADFADQVREAVSKPADSEKRTLTSLLHDLRTIYVDVLLHMIRQQSSPEQASRTCAIRAISKHDFDQGFTPSVGTTGGIRIANPPMRLMACRP